MGVLRIILWSWLAVSLAIYGYRLVRWIGRRGAGDAEADPADTPSPGRGDAIGATGTTAVAAAPEQRKSRRARRQEQIDAMKAPADGLSPTERLFREAAAARSEDPGDAGSGAERHLAAMDEPPDMAELLEGLDWPCELSPHVVDGWNPYYRIAFVTTGFDAEAVRAAMGGRLEGLGFELHDLGSRTVADGARGRFAMTVHDTGADALDPQAIRALGVLPRGAVVVELGTRW